MQTPSFNSTLLAQPDARIADLANKRSCHSVPCHALGELPLLVYNPAALNESEFFIPLPNAAALRVRYLKDRGQILRFVVQLEMLIESHWTPIVRYDNAHQFVHRDDLKPDGSQIKTPPMAFANNEDAFNFALQDLRTNYRFYTDRYGRWRTE
ncbi:MAG: hypothetical protein V9H69_05025 [Anaerolineae bacterium]